MKIFRASALIAIGLLLGTAGCASSRPLTQWRPGVYHYRTTLQGTGEVSGSIEVGLDGPESVSSSVGVCDEVMYSTPREMRARIDGVLAVRSFVCGTEHRFSVGLGREGGPPIEGVVSNQRTEMVVANGDPVCRQYKTVETEEGTDRVCVVWDNGPRAQPRTTGATARWRLVADPFAPPP
jgi:hypothetical protein